MQFKDFKALDNVEKYICLLSGHTYRIGADWQKVPEFAWKDCYATGCISKDMITRPADDKVEAEVIEQLNNQAIQRQEIESIFRGWVAENRLDHFDAKGKPKMNLLSEELGYKVTRQIRDKIWFNLVNEGKI